MGNETVLTSEGKKALEKELETLKVVTRNEVAEKIRVAREFGDISENAEYDAAKEEQAMVEGRIIELEQRLANARIIDDKVDTSVVSLGCTVRVKEIINGVEGSEETFRIVGSMETDPFNNKISNESPVGSALMGCKKGDIAVATIPDGRKISFKIIKIS